MTTNRLAAVLLIAVAATAAFARTRGGAAGDGRARTFKVEGGIVAPPPDGRITVAHKDIAGYMPAMTMTFSLGSGISAPLAAGDRVRFRLRVTAEQSHA